MEIPECPLAEHAGSIVVRAGWYGKPPHRRQRWLCRPANGDRRHRFTPVLTRQGEPNGYCVECSTGLEPWEGQAGAREYRFSAREVGEALAAVAAGASYRAAAEAARRRAHRLAAGAARRSGARRRDPLRDGQIVANWVDVFAEAVCTPELPRRWPRTLLVDSKAFRIRSGENAGRGFHVFAAMGIEAPEPGRWAPAPKIWRLEPFGRRDQASWEAFFGSLAGAPKVIVSDPDHALTAAIESVFGEAAPSTASASGTWGGSCASTSRPRSSTTAATRSPGHLATPSAARGAGGRWSRRSRPSPPPSGRWRWGGFSATEPGSLPRSRRATPPPLTRRARSSRFCARSTAASATASARSPTAPGCASSSPSWPSR